ncbi:hypothetical protein QBC46DRAFT_412483 [Diplogelasinospora grovesii]|uniref:Uncharacterized protein n=1 Tax=Diplogelasinospora grovesii TaxID=303347 RepID=A0AAN6RZV8_9PEZI|nr:hypothetical protein QBC46DRAFT_412483 [Diplogelasinospora grovesii]
MYEEKTVDLPRNLWVQEKVSFNNHPSIAFGVSKVVTTGRADFKPSRAHQPRAIDFILKDRWPNSCPTTERLGKSAWLLPETVSTATSHQSRSGPNNRLERANNSLADGILASVFGHSQVVSPGNLVTEEGQAVTRANAETQVSIQVYNQFQFARWHMAMRNTNDSINRYPMRVRRRKYRLPIEVLTTRNGSTTSFACRGQTVPSVWQSSDQATKRPNYVYSMREIDKSVIAVIMDREAFGTLHHWRASPAGIFFCQSPSPEVAVGLVTNYICTIYGIDVTLRSPSKRSDRGLDNESRRRPGKARSRRTGNDDDDDHHQELAVMAAFRKAGE